MKNNLYNPKVSIIIPVYNGANYLEEAIDSALKQTYENIEVIVVNDGSTDNGLTEEIAKSYGEKIKYIYKENGGVSSALNCGIKEMSGEYFSWLSHDDVYEEDKVENGVELLQSLNLIGKKCIAYTGGKYINAEGKFIKNMKEPFVSNKLYSKIDAVNIMTQKGTLNGCCMLIPKVAFYDVGLFDERLRYSQDSLMWYRIILNDYSIVSDNKCCVFSRIHKQQVTLTRKDLYEHDALHVAKLLAKSLADCDESGKIYFQYLKRATKHQCKDAINFLLEYGIKNGIISQNKLFVFKFINMGGKFRNIMASSYKKLITFSKS